MHIYTCIHTYRIPSFSGKEVGGEVSLVFYLGLRLTGPPTLLWRAICFTQSPRISMLISPQNTLAEASEEC